jgi:hypothetical protein
MKTLYVLLAAMACAVASPAAEPQVVFEDAFQVKPGPGWSWLREHPGYWRFGEKALEIRVEPGRAPDVKNALVRPAPDRSQGKYAIEVTITNTVPATNQYEQAGITWYVDGKPVVKIVKELVKGEPCMILGGPKAAAGKQGGPRRAVLADKTARLRLVVTADEFAGQYQAGAKGKFESLGAGALPPAKNDQVSIQCYNGAAEAEHWFRFENFRILRVE